MTPCPILRITRNEPEGIGSVIQLHTLGDTLITVGEKHIRPTAPMVFAALLYLGIERGRRVPRAALQELLFPQSDERSGAHSLRQLLYKLRQLGAPIETDAATASIDAKYVEDDCVLSNGADNGKVERFALGFLPDYAPAISERFDVWLEQQRMSVAAGMRRQLAARLSERRNAADRVATERYARLLLTIDPLNEEATLSLAESAALVGSKAKALDILSRYEQETGRRDLQLAPALLRKRIAEAVPDHGVSPGAMPLFGRERELSEISTTLRAARGGRPGVIVIAGEAGIGKTRLLEEVVTISALEGVRTHVVRCRPHYSSRPLSIFIELVPTLMASRGALGASPESLRQLKALVRHSDDPDVANADVGDDVARSEALRRAIRDLFDAVVAERPMLLAVEDVHWCDEVSLRELSALAGEATWPMATIVTTRSPDLLRRSHFGESVVVHKLQPLQPEPMSALTARLLGQSDSPTTRDWCVRVAAGNPLFLRMLCARINETGELQVPADLMAVISRRLEQLPTSSRRALAFCALLGPYCTIESLRSLLETSHLALIECVSQLEDEGYIRSTDDSIRIAHDLVVDAVLGLATPVTKRALHASVASFLEQKYEAAGDTAVLWDCAEQWRLSGEPQKSLELIRQCANHASRMGHAQQAMQLLARARPLAKSSKDSASLIGDMMLTAKAAGELQDVHRLAKELTAFAIPAHDRLELLGLEAEWLVACEARTQRLFLCLQSETATPQHRIEACVLLLRMGFEMLDEPMGHEAFEYIRPLIASAAPHERLTVQIMYHSLFGSHHAAAEFIDELQLLMPSMPAVGDRLAAGRNVAMGLAAIGRYDQGTALTKRLYDLARELGLKSKQSDLGMLLCALYRDLNDFESVRFWFDRVGQEPPDERIRDLHLGVALELALLRRERLEAEMLFGALSGATFTQRFARHRLYLVATKVRIAQLDPTYLCDPQTLERLRNARERSKRFMCEDFALPLVEDLRRRGLIDEAISVIDQYARQPQRGGRPLPPSLATIRAELRPTE